MAFDRADADAVYDAVETALEPMGIRTLRVDRIEHNDDIDKRIIAEIEAADFVLADLTYARPSVYFEAGYAQRVTPVVYIARRDHFKDKPEDPNGNLRVHFDLQMRNIIAWSSGHDQTFLKRLKARVKTVIAPLLNKRNADTQAKSKVAAFDQLSFQDKQNSLIRVAKAHFRKLGYKITDLTYKEADAPKTLFPMAPRAFFGAAVAMKQSRGTFHFVLLHAPPSVTVKLCDVYRMWLIRHTLYSMKVFLPPQQAPKRLREDVVVCSLGSGGLNRLRKRITYLRTGEADHMLVHDMQFTIVRPGKQIEVPRRITFHVFESNARLLALDSELQRRFKT